MEGHNPELYKGRRITLNVNLGGNILEAVTQSLEMYNVPTKLMH